jgi:outer membrane protein, heavy metal efflux system
MTSSSRSDSVFRLMTRLVRARSMRAGASGLAFVALSLVAASAAAQTAQPPSTGALTFNAALDLAMSRNLGLAAARRQRAIREAAIRAARQIHNPDVSAEITRDTPHEVLSFSVPIEIGGKRGRRVDLAKEELGLADIDVRTELRAVRREVRVSFYSLIASDERLRLADGAVSIARRVRDAAQARFDTGAAPRLEVLQADLGLTRAETDLDLARSTRAADQASLNAVLNLPPQQPLAVAGTLADDVTLASNVDLITLDRQITIEQRRLELLRAERVPTPAFSLSGAFNSPGEYTFAPGAGVSLTVPIFSRNQGEIAQSIATTSQLSAQRDATRRDVENSVFGTVAKIDANRRRVDAFTQRLVPTATNLESLAEESYRAGRTSVLAVLDAQRSLRDLSLEALQASLDLQTSLADLEELLGTAIP